MSTSLVVRGAMAKLLLFAASALAAGSDPLPIGVIRGEPEATWRWSLPAGDSWSVLTLDAPCPVQLELIDAGGQVLRRRVNDGGAELRTLEIRWPHAELAGGSLSLATGDPSCSFMLRHSVILPTPLEDVTWRAELASERAEQALRTGVGGEQNASIAAFVDRLERLIEGDPLVASRFYEELGYLAYEMAGDTPTLADKAVELLQHAIAARERHHHGDAPEAYPLTRDLASILFNAGRLDEAEAVARRGIRMLEELGDDALLAEGWTELATIDFQRGRYVESREALDRAGRAAASEPSGLAVDQRVAMWRLEAELARVIDRFDLAERFHRLILDLPPDELPAHDLYRAETWNNLAGVSKDRGRLDLAETALDNARRILEVNAATDTRQRLRSELNRAEILTLQRRTDDAENLYRSVVDEARRLLPREDPTRALIVSRLAVLLADRGRREEAEPLYREAIEDFESALGSHHPMVAEARLELARFLLAGERLDEATHEVERALAARQRIHGEDHPELGIALTVAARIEAARGPDHRAAALVTIRRARRLLAPSSAFPAEEATAMVDEATLLAASGSDQAALQLLHQALDRVESLRLTTGGTETTRAVFLSRYLAWYETGIAWSLGQGRIEDAFALAERRRARVLLESLAAADSDWRGAIPAAVRGPLEIREQALRLELAASQARLRAATEGRLGSLVERRRRLAQLEEETSQLATQLAEVVQDLREASPRWQELAASTRSQLELTSLQETLLPSGSAVLGFVVGEEGSWLFYLPAPPESPEVLPLIVPPNDAATLAIPAGPLTRDNLVAAVADDATGAAGIVTLLARSRSADDLWFDGGGGSLVQRLAALWRVLIPPSLRQRLTELEQLVILSDGPLHAVPWAALVSEAPARDHAIRYWLDSGPVLTSAPSLATLAALAERPLATDHPTALVVADPDFTTADPGRLPLTRLPGTAREAESIVAHLSRWEVEVLTRRQATESRVRERLSHSPLLVHFATHGFVTGDADGGRSMLALASPQVGPGSGQGLAEDGQLQLFEIYDLQLPRTELVVLSACDTQRGPSLAGEGAFGITRGFMVAGARRVIATLWAVDDDSSAELVDIFYEHFARGDGAAEALRHAQRRLRRQPGREAPFFWAGFVHSGPPDKLRGIRWADESRDPTPAGSSEPQLAN